MNSPREFTGDLEPMEPSHSQESQKPVFESIRLTHTQHMTPRQRRAGQSIPGQAWTGPLGLDTKHPNLSRLTY